MQTHSGAVAAGHPLTAETAAEVLRAGGNAFDAVAAGLFTACVAEPILASVGGGGFLMAGLPDGEDRLYDFFVQTPRQAQGADADFYPITADFGATTQEFHIGLGSVATPGVVRGVFEAQRELGRMPLPEVMAPAVAHARNGVTVNALQSYIHRIVAPIFSATPGAVAVFGGDSGDVVAAGQRQRFPILADLLESLAIEGEDLFYRGEVAQALVGLCAERGGHLGMADLAGYRVLRREPLRSRLGDWRFATNPPPSSGGVLVALALQILDAMSLDYDHHGTPAHGRALMEVMRLTQEARLACADGDLARLADPGLVRAYREQVSGRPRFSRGTTHISVVDEDGRLAALTVSNGEGCGHVVPGCGFMPNNMLGEEDLNPGGFGLWARDTRMTSMMAPSILRHQDGGTVMALGSGGSNRIRSALFQVISGMLYFGLPAEAAVNHPRIHWEKDFLHMEQGWSQATLESLCEASPAHKVWAEQNLFFGGAHLAGLRGGEPIGAGDPRRGGVFVRV